MKLLSATILLCLLTMPLHAQNTQSFYAASQDKSQSKFAQMRHSSRDLSDIKPAKPATANSEQDSTTDNSSEMVKDIWQKYKALAGGEESTTTIKTKETAKGTIPVKPIKEVKKPDTPEGNKKPVTGLSAILEQYQNTKQTRSKMHSLTIRKAEPATDKAQEAQE